MPTHPLCTRRVGEPRTVLVVEPVQLALCNWLPELGDLSSVTWTGTTSKGSNDRDGEVAFSHERGIASALYPREQTGRRLAAVQPVAQHGRSQHPM